ncbi:MAG: ribonuclease HI [Proteobacteria bacterium]|nr:ribonuclease HI [Pseudomonadota bacterium]
MQSRSKVKIYTDGACLGNPGPGGWAALMRYGQKERLISGSELLTTNNRMELLAVINGLQVLSRSCDVNVVTDSRYVIDAFEKEWINKWVENNWTTSSNSSVKNQDLWMILHSLVNFHEVSWTWVKGHSGHKENEIVDQEARLQAEKLR